MAEIWLYTADSWDVDQADAYVRQIAKDIGRALDLSSVGSPVAGLPLAYRKVRSGSHRIIFRRTGQELTVLRVLHERQDLPDEIED